MGYELLLRPPAPNLPVALDALVGKLLEAAANGVPPLAQVSPPLAASASPTPPASPASPAPSTPSTPSIESAPAAPPLPSPLPLGPWTLKNGRGRVEVKLSKLEGADGYRGADFDIPFGGTEEELRTAFAFVVSLADQLKLSAFDPQLANLVGKGSEEAVVDRWRSSKDWMVDTVGVLDDDRSVAPLTEPPSAINRTNKVILAIIGLLVLLWWIWSSLSTADLLAE